MSILQSHRPPLPDFWILPHPKTCNSVLERVTDTPELLCYCLTLNLQLLISFLVCYSIPRTAFAGGKPAWRLTQDGITPV